MVLRNRVKVPHSESQIFMSHQTYEALTNT